MLLEIQLSPENEDEVEVLERLTDAREYALEETDLSKGEVAAMFSQFAAGVALEIDVDEEDEGLQCPECGSNVENVTSMGMGASPIMDPCGCEVDWNELPPDLYLDD